MTDGASAGTSELSIGINPIDLTVMNSELLFNAADATSKHGLWVSDGTSAGTSELSVAGAAPSGLDPKNLFVVGSEALFAGTDAGGHQNLWITDGPAGGTSKLSVAEANSEGLFSNSTVPSFTLFGSEILFAGMDAARSSDVFANPGLFVATVTSGTVGELSCCRHSKPTHTASAPRTSRSSTAKCCFRDLTTTAATSSYGRPTAPLTELRRSRPAARGACSRPSSPCSAAQWCLPASTSPTSTASGQRTER